MSLQVWVFNEVRPQWGPYILSRSDSILVFLLLHATVLTINQRDWLFFQLSRGKDLQHHTRCSAVWLQESGISNYILCSSPNTFHLNTSEERQARVKHCKSYFGTAKLKYLRNMSSPWFIATEKVAEKAWHWGFWDVFAWPQWNIEVIEDDWSEHFFSFELCFTKHPRPWLDRSGKILRDGEMGLSQASFRPCVPRLKTLKKQTYANICKHKQSFNIKNQDPTEQPGAGMNSVSVFVSPRCS